jgi:DHA2 family multidrug resistance protein-like MFS transporter
MKAQEQSFTANAVLVVLTLFPGLINTSAVNFAAGTIARDLSESPFRVSALVLLNDAALAFGCLLAAELTRRIANRPLYLAMLVVSVAASLGSCLAPNFAFLGAAHFVHGLAGGMLFVTALPPFFVKFAPTRIRSLVAVLIPSLFGATTLGPIAAAALQRPNEWRLLFAVEIVLAIVALLLARATLPRTPLSATAAPVDWIALVLAGLGSIGIFVAAGNLARSGWLDPAAFIPAVIGIGSFVVMFGWEAIQKDPLVPVRHLLGSIAIVGTVSTVAGSAVYSATQTTMTLELERLWGFSLSATGLAFWPAAIGALFSGWLYAQLVTTRWVTIVGPAGIAVSLAAVSLGLLVRPLPAGAIEATLFVAAVGAGLSVTPGLFMVGLSFERALVTRAIALLNMLRLTGGFISVPGVEHSIGSRAAEHVHRSLPAIPPVETEHAARTYLLTGAGQSGIPHAVLADAVRAGIAGGLVVAVGICIVALAIVAVLLATRGIRLEAPRVQLIAEGRPALGTS